MTTRGKLVHIVEKVLPECLAQVALISLLFDRQMLVGRKALVRSEKVVVALTREPDVEDQTCSEIEDKTDIRKASHPTFKCPIYSSASRCPTSLLGTVAVRSGLTKIMLHKTAVAFVIDR